MKAGLVAAVMVVIGLGFLATPSLKAVGVVCLLLAGVGVVVGRRG